MFGCKSMMVLILICGVDQVSLIETIVLPYSKAWNRQLADRVQKILPVEIRSMVYNYLLDDDTWNGFCYQLEAVLSVLPSYVGHCGCIKMSHDMPRAPHFLYPEYMGMEAALEIVEKLYCSDWFKERTLYSSIERLESVIHRDPFGTGFDLASRVRNLHITCVVDQYRILPHAHTLSTSCQHTPYERRYVDQDRLKSDLDQLLGVVQNEHLQSLKVTFIQCNIRIDVLEEALEAFVCVHSASKKVGVSMRLNWMYYMDSICEGYGHAHSKDLSNFFAEQRYTWKRRMLLFLKDVRRINDAEW